MAPGHPPGAIGGVALPPPSPPADRVGREGGREGGKEGGREGGREGERVGGEGEREIFYTMITQYYACYAVLRMLRNSTQFYSCYANITQKLRIDNAIFTQ